jgi:hypothetical protein
MKLIRADGEQCWFEVETKEKHLLFDLLRLYPVIPAGYPKLSRTGAKPEDQQLLEQALAVQREENRRHVLDLLAARTRFRASPKGHRFELKHGEMEWLLQVLNDVRVGSWLLLGSPDPLQEVVTKLNESNVRHFWAMEVAAHFQMGLLKARSGAGAKD